MMTHLLMKHYNKTYFKIQLLSDSYLSLLDCSIHFAMFIKI